MEEIKILAVGDLHGKSCWQAIDFSQYDKIIFMGDYVDSTSHSDEEILDNLNAVIRAKESHPEKIVLLLGNHDIQYLYYPEYRCSGFRRSMQISLTELFSRHRHFFQMAYQSGNYLFSHAGLSRPWHDRFMTLLDKIPLGEARRQGHQPGAVPGQSGRERGGDRRRPLRGGDHHGGAGQQIGPQGRPGRAGGGARRRRGRRRGRHRRHRQGVGTSSAAIAREITTRWISDVPS